jgi:hypothetical protein
MLAKLKGLAGLGRHVHVFGKFLGFITDIFRKVRGVYEAKKAQERMDRVHTDTRNEWVRRYDKNRRDDASKADKS